MNEILDNDVAEQTAEPQENEAGRPGRKSSLTRSIPSDRLTFTRQCDILRAYPAAYDKVAGAVTIDELSGFVEMAPSTISQANSFFTETGLIRKDGRRFVPSPELQAMFRVYGMSKERAWAKLAPVFERSWIGQLLVPKLKYRPLSEEDAVHELAEAATAEVHHLPQVRTIVEYLLLVGLVVRDGGVLRLASNSGVEEVSGAGTPPTSALSEKPANPGEPEIPPAILLLDPAGHRRVVVQAPSTITTRELERIRAWLGVQLIIEDAEETTKSS